MKETISYISSEMCKGNNLTYSYTFNDVPYKVYFICDDKNKKINIPSIIAIPISDNYNNQIMLEANNMESENFEEIITQAIKQGERLLSLTNEFPCPIVIPLIPSYKNAPYFQQLSQDSFYISETDKNYRIDEQIIQIINKAKNMIEMEKGIKPNEKIFLNGYASSGVFAQRFSLIHPEIIETACIGGASGSIPIVSDMLDYPLGIGSYAQIFGKGFNLEEYKKIKFRYYVGELELLNKSPFRFDENGNSAPKHDMSYFDRSVSEDIGFKQRQMFGTNMFDRIKNIIALLQETGIDIEHTTIEGRTHNDEIGIGVNELGDAFIKEIYEKSKSKTL